MGDSRGCSRHRAVLRVAAGALLALLILTGCNSSGETPTSLPTTSPTPSASPTPSPSATTAKQQVEATVRAYYEAMDVAIRTGDVGPYEAITTNSCGCRSLVGNVRKVFAGGSTEDAGVQFVRVLKLHERRVGSYDVESIAHVNAYDELNETGEVLHHYRAQTANRILSMTPRTDGTFVVYDVTYVGRVS